MASSLAPPPKTSWPPPAGLHLTLPRSSTVAALLISCYMFSVAFFSQSPQSPFLVPSLPQSPQPPLPSPPSYPHMPSSCSRGRGSSFMTLFCVLMARAKGGRNHTAGPQWAAWASGSQPRGKGSWGPNIHSASTLTRELQNPPNFPTEMRGILVFGIA